MTNKSIADEVMEFLKTSRKPKSMREIVRALDYKYDSVQVSVSIRYWVIKGVIIAENKDGYKRNKQYSIDKIG